MRRVRGSRYFPFDDLLPVHTLAMQKQEGCLRGLKLWSIPIVLLPWDGVGETSAAIAARAFCVLHASPKSARKNLIQLVLADVAKAHYRSNIGLDLPKKQYGLLQ